MYGYGYGYMTGFAWDWTYLLIIIGAVICLAASAKMRTTYNKFSQYRSNSCLTGAEAAQRILLSQGITDVAVVHISGNLTDHYNPVKKTLALSDATYASRSVAAVGVAAHECGHAVQHANGYAPLNIRGALVPAANIGSGLSWPLIIIGLLMNQYTVGYYILQFGIILFSLVVLFQLVTLPVEINASNRALKILRNTNILEEQELKYTRQVLTAAALTYVASAASAILQLLRILLIANGSRRD